jgi:hypothetical protein
VEADIANNRIRIFTPILHKLVFQDQITTL